MRSTGRLLDPHQHRSTGILVRLRQERPQSTPDDRHEQPARVLPADTQRMSGGGEESQVIGGRIGQKSGTHGRSIPHVQTVGIAQLARTYRTQPTRLAGFSHHPPFLVLHVRKEFLFSYAG